jgi:tight adherence protein B
MALLSSLFIALCVALLVRYGFDVVARWLATLTNIEAKKYRQWVEELFLNLTPAQIQRAAYAINLGIIFLTLGILLLTGSLIFAVVAAFVTYRLPTILYRIFKEKRLQRINHQLPDAVNLLVSSVRAGRSLPQAFEDVARKMSAPIGQEFQVMVREYTQGGLNIEGILERARTRLNLESFTMISTALIINCAQGGDVLTMLERMSESVRELSKLEKKIVTETSGVRAQEKIILFLTPAFGLLVCLFDPGVPKILFNSVFGNLLLVVVGALQILSIFWIRRIVKATI